MNLSRLLVDAGLLPQFKFSLAQKKMSHEENPLALASATSSYQQYILVAKMMDMLCNNNMHTYYLPRSPISAVSVWVGSSNRVCNCNCNCHCTTELSNDSTRLDTTRELLLLQFTFFVEWNRLVQYFGSIHEASQAFNLGSINLQWTVDFPSIYGYKHFQHIF